MKNEENNNGQARNCPSPEFSPNFLSWAQELKKEKVGMLNLLVTMQRLLLTDTSSHTYPDEYIDQLDAKLMVLQGLIINA